MPRNAAKPNALPPGSHVAHPHKAANGGVNKGGDLHQWGLHRGPASHNFEGEGTDGNDVQHGGAGSDMLDGGKGYDTLSGGTGPDAFCFGPGDSGIGAGHRDVITDFGAHDVMGFIEFAGPGRVLSTNILHAKSFDIVQLLVNGTVTAEIEVLGHYKWHDYNFVFGL